MKTARRWTEEQARLLVEEHAAEVLRTSEALRQSRDELQLIYDGMVEGLVIVDAQTKRIVGVNSSFCRMLGYAKEDLLSLSIMDIHPTDDRAGCAERIQSRSRRASRGGSKRPHAAKGRQSFFRRHSGQHADLRRTPLCAGPVPRHHGEETAQAALERERQTLRHLLQSSDHERQLIAYEIHDGLAQLLAAASMQFEAYAHLKDEKPSEAADAYDAALTLLRRSHSESRRLISGVRPLALDEAGIVAAVTHLVDAQRRENGPTIEFHHQVQFERLVPILENAIYRIVQEGLANACRHGKSQRIRVELLQHDGNLRIKIQDWGIGFDPEEVGEGHFGLAGMRERARLLGGSIGVESRPRKGTCITVELPLMTRE